MNATELDEFCIEHKLHPQQKEVIVNAYGFISYLEAGIDPGNEEEINLALTQSDNWTHCVFVELLSREFTKNSANYYHYMQICFAKDQK